MKWPNRKRDDRYNNYFDNYGEKISGNIVLVLVYIVVGGILYFALK